MKKLIFLFVFVFFVFSLASVSAINWNDNLIAYYNFDQLGTTITDIVGVRDATGYNGTQQGSTGIVNNSYGFNGDDAAQLPTTFGILDDGQYSLNFWINPNSMQNDMYPFSFQGEVNMNTNFISASAWRVEHNGINATIVTDIPTGSWTMITVVANSTNRRVYKNAVLNASINGPDALDPGAFSTNWFGQREGGAGAYPYDGYLDEFSIWDRDLTQSDINELWNAGNGLTYPTGNITVNLDKPLDNAYLLNSFLFTYNATSVFITDNTTIENLTLYIWDNRNGNLYNTYFNTLSPGTNKSSYFVTDLVVGDYKWNALGCGNTTAEGNATCSFASTNRTFIFGLTNQTYEYEGSAYELFTSTYNNTFNVSSGTPTATLWFNGTGYAGTGTNIAGDKWRFDRTITQPSDGIKNWFWEVITNGVSFNTTSKTQTVTLSNISLCSNPYTVPFINFTYKNETVAQEVVTAQITSSSWFYYGDSISVNKSFSYSTTTESLSHAFCFSDPSKTFNVDISYSYDNSESQQRIYNPDFQTLTNTTFNKGLFLLPTSDGIFVTFQVVDGSDNPLEGVSVTATRTDFGEINTQVTDAAGVVSIFLNPDFAYTLTFSKSGYTPYTTTITPSQTTYTVTLATVTTPTADNNKGIDMDINPNVGTRLVNDTTYNFNITLASSTLTITEFGFRLFNKTSDQLAFSSASTNGGTINVALNTGNHSNIIMNYYYVISGNYTNSSVSWVVMSGEDEGFGLSTFFTDLRNFANTGTFGLGGFGLALIVFITIFIMVGVLSYKYGLTSPAAIMGVVFGMVLLFDVALGFDLNPTGINVIPNFTTVFTLILLIGVIFWESNR